MTAVDYPACLRDLIESEIFGYVRGAFTGATENRAGAAEQADGGTLFLDEVGDIPPSVQVKLLRVLEDRKTERVGDNSSIPVDVRVITATHKRLSSLIEEGLFREDLYFRINVFPITCPPLCDRTEDIPIIVQHLIQRNNLKTDKNITGATPAAIEKMTAYAWPGNVRELRNAIDYAFALCSSTCIGIKHLPAAIGRTASNTSDNITDKVNHGKRAELIRALRQTGGNRSEAARILGVSRVTVWKQINKFGIDIHRELAV